ncbi:Leucine-rich repeats and immunoglobulin-like domains protein sma-10 [Candida viswanathii]|uniref:Leucine-rich repeats and immunoglobulin-like domains protein sma-10 n=1 Tax=Candida viswanathii TaxID=5486 RepID=A0A367XP90_9ASCO|nr:Leucine-rich repeats and immunoglobulin-like domains protein sma-10 [Candida viswanathii]
MPQLAEFPSSVLERIFTHVPNDILVTLIDADTSPPHVPSTIRNTAAKVLYSEVVVARRSRINNIPELRGVDKVPVLTSVSELKWLQRSYPLVRPRKWVFEEALGVFSEAEGHAGVFDDAETLIEVQFSEHWDEEEYCAAFVEGYLERPFRVTSLVDFNLDAIEDEETGRVLGRELVRFETSAGFDTAVDFGKLGWFEKLRCLSVEIEFSPTYLGRLPRQLTVLSVCLVFEDGDYDKERRDEEDLLIKFEFPEGLRELDIEFAEQCALTTAYNIDISHLSRLRKLGISTILTTGTKNAYCLWKLPGSLRWLSYITYHSMLEPLKTMCPHLAFLRVQQADDMGGMDYIVNDLPESLQELETSAEGLVGYITSGDATSSGEPPSYGATASAGAPPSYGADAATEDAPSTAAPASSDAPPSYDTPDVEENPKEKPENTEFKLSFPASLRKLSIDGYLSEFGNTLVPILLPRSITNLSLTEVINVDWTRLETLTNLTHLVIRTLKGVDAFAYNLPQSLRSLEISDHRLKGFRIVAPHLTDLVLRGNLSATLTDARLVIPSSVRNLSLRSCRIEEINIEFPDSLETLDLAMNTIKSIKHLPPNLKLLDLSKNRIGSTDDVSQFPSSLETLNLSWNSIHEQWICRQEFTQLAHLKNLYLARNNFRCLDLDGLPRSLVALDVHAGAVTSFLGDFKRLVNLRELDVLDSRLTRYIELLDDEDFSFFGDNIRYVNVKGCRLSSDAMFAIVQELLAKPGFEYLDMAPDSVQKE